MFLIIRPKITYQFSCGESLLNYTDTYKYLGYMIHEHLCETKNVEIMTACASRSFSRIHSILINYASGVWVLQNRVMPLFLGIHKFAPNAATKIEMDWLGCREKRWLNMIRLYSRINVMPLSRLSKIIYDWDVNSGASSWSSEVRHIIHKLNLDPYLEWGEIYDLTAVNNKLIEMSRLSWNLESFQKPKLRPFFNVHDFDSYQAIVKSSLTRTQRSKLVHLKFGILPLKYETDRYQGIAPEHRLCKSCTLNVPEDEIHFLYQCPALFTTRVKFLQRFSEDNLEFGDAHIENMSNLLKKNILFQRLYTQNLFIRNAKVLCTCDFHWNVWRTSIVLIVLYHYHLYQ